MALIKNVCKLAVTIALGLVLPFELSVYSHPLQSKQNQTVQEALNKLSPQQQVLADILGTMQSLAAFSEPNPPKNVLFLHLLRALRPNAIIITLAKLKEQFDKNALKTNDFYKGKRVLLLATSKSIDKSSNGQTLMNLSVDPNSKPFLTITLQDSPENREAIPLIPASSPVLLNCLYVSVGSGMVLRQCQLERKLVMELLEQVVAEIDIALFGKSSIPMAILNAILVKDIVEQLSDKKKFSDGAQICLKRDEECISTVAFILLHTDFKQSEEKIISVLQKLGYPQHDIDKLTREISKLTQ